MKTLWEKAVSSAVPALIVAFVLGALALGRSSAAQETRIQYVESRQDRDSVSITAMVIRLEEKLSREQEQRQRDMTELRAFMVQILKDLKKE